MVEGEVEGASSRYGWGAIHQQPTKGPFDERSLCDADLRYTYNSHV
jgi:hypothetical protein